MPTHKLKEEYKRLRNELENAYAAPVWNSVQIDRIANALARIEQTWMRCNVFQQPRQLSQVPAARQCQMSQA